MKRTIIFLVLAIFAVTTYAQRNSFVNNYLELRQPQEGEAIEVKRMGRRDIRRELRQPQPLASESQIQTEEELQQSLHNQAMLRNIRRLDLVVDMEYERVLSLSQINDLLRPYERLISVNVDDMEISLYGTVRRDRISQLVGFMGDGDDVNMLFNISFRRPIALAELTNNPNDFQFQQLISINGTEEEQRNAIMRFNFSRSATISMSGFDSTPPGFDSTPSTLEVVQIDGKYIVRTVEEGGIFAHSRKLCTKPIILGSNPGNTYVMTFCSLGNNIILLDRYGFTVAWGEKMTPVYVLGCEEEIAAFIIWDSRNGYSLYECPEVYALVQRGSLETRDLRWTPHIERRFVGAQSIVVTEDGYFRVVKEDGVVEYIPIRRQ